MFMCTVANFIVLALDKFDIDKSRLTTLNTLNYIFYGFYVAEVIILLFAYKYENGKEKDASKHKNYFYDIWNIFDFGIVIFSTIDIILNLATNIELTTLGLLRALRLVRVFRIANHWGPLRKLMK